MKIIAMYLPQFHRIPENDEWWGEGFTEWTAVKNAASLFEGHLQPKKPLNQNYYNLMNRSTMEWQAGLMEKYGVDGLCFYHYWFKDGRRILEKPAEKLLEWKDINIPYCFCWANETWARSWSGLSGINVWADKYEKKSDKTILLEQKYGSQNDWIDHFEYLLQFFRDDRYLKVDGRPIIMLYKCSIISRLPAMIDCWRKLAKQNGFPDLFVIGGNSARVPYGVLDRRIMKEPQTDSHKVECKKINGVEVKEYDDFWDRILSADESDPNMLFSCFVNYDDTPRRAEKGYVVRGGNPKKFEHYLYELLIKNHRKGNSLTFVNAWNEWGEGMYLEPDEQYGYAYLESISNAKHQFESTSIIVENTHKLNKKVNNSKDTIYLHLLSKWMRLRERGVKLSEYFICNGFSNIAIYGYGVFAEHLIEELKCSGITVKYVIDKNLVDAFIPTYRPGIDCSDVDAVIVCSFYYFEEIYSNLKQNCCAEILSIENIINELG